MAFPANPASYTCAITHIVADGNESIVRAALAMTTANPEDVDPSFTVALPDGSILENWIPLGDASAPNQDYPGFSNRKIDFSFRIPSNASSFELRATDRRSARYLAENKIEPEDIVELRTEWADLMRSADADPDYEKWFLARRAPLRDIELQRDIWRNFTEQPVFSFIVPLYKTPLNFLRDMADSVLAQTYPNLELILVNASPEDVSLERAVRDYLNRDARVKQVVLEKNLGITENTNFGIREAAGDFLAFLDHDDTIEPDTLYWYVKAINDHPDTDLLYCDEDHLQDGRYVLPFFKPDWDIDLLCSENYVCHMLTVRKTLVDALPALPTSKFDGSQDHNMSFLIGEQARHVAHIPRVLYHWRIHQNSVSGAGLQQKSYALEAGRLAIQEHLGRCDIDARAEMDPRNPIRYVVNYHFSTQPLVSIIIPSHNGKNVLTRCLDSIFEKTTWRNYEIVIVENGSTDPNVFTYYENVSRDHDNVKVITHDLPNGFDFSALINAGAEASSGEYLLMLNNDTEVITPGWIELMVGPCSREDVGCVGAKLLYPDGTLQHGGVIMHGFRGPLHVNPFHPRDAQGYYENNMLTHQLSAVTGACLLTKASIFDELGGLDELFPVDYNDIDYCLKLRAKGLAVVQQNRAELYHYESVSRGLNKTRRQIEGLVEAEGLFTERWIDYVRDGDPFYNRNFMPGDAYYRLHH